MKKFIFTEQNIKTINTTSIQLSDTLSDVNSNVADIGEHYISIICEDKLSSYNGPNQPI